MEHGGGGELQKSRLGRLQRDGRRIAHRWSAVDHTNASQTSDILRDQNMKKSYIYLGDSPGHVP